MKKYADRKEIKIGIKNQSTDLKEILKDSLLKSLVYEKALKESTQKTA